jgi:chemotaxis protein MotB
MMAFFLLMWLLNVTTEEQKNAISNYFDPTHPRVSSELSGSGGILGGMTMSPEGAQVSNVQSIAVPNPTRQPSTRIGQETGEQSSENAGASYDRLVEGLRAPEDTQSDDDPLNDLQDGVNIFDPATATPEKLEIDQLEQIVEAAQNEEFEDIKQQILDEVQKAPELADLMDHLMVDVTPEGLRIQIIDKEGRSMFPIGSADMFEFMRALVGKVTQVIIPQPNQISVRGHTDGKPYPEGASYNNWNLSSDRAIASQRAMLDAGLPIERVQNVVGKADREHLFPEEPLSARNRRISVILLREQLGNEDEIRSRAAEAIKAQAEKLNSGRPVGSQRPMDDREDIPELDQRVNTQSPLTEAVEEFETPAEDYAETPETGDIVGDEIQRIRDRNAARNVPRPLPGPSQGQPAPVNEPQVLEFP